MSTASVITLRFTIILPDPGSDCQIILRDNRSSRSKALGQGVTFDFVFSSASCAVMKVLMSSAISSSLSHCSL